MEHPRTWPQRIVRMHGKAMTRAMRTGALCGRPPPAQCERAGNLL